MTVRQFANAHVEDAARLPALNPASINLNDHYVTDLTLLCSASGLSTSRR